MKRPWAFICAAEGTSSAHLRRYCRTVFECATVNAQLGLAKKYSRVCTTLDGIIKAAARGESLVS